MMSRGIVFVVALAACHPAPSRTLPVEVRSVSAPVAEAVVIVKCATDARGRVVLPMTEGDEATTCRVLAGSVGYRTLEARPARICVLAPCAPWVLTLEAVGSSR